MSALSRRGVEARSSCACRRAGCSRKPDDIPAFVKKSIEELTEPQHDEHAAR